MAAMSSSSAACSQHDWARSYAERPGVTVVDNAEHVFDGLQRLAADSAESAELVWA